MLLKSQSDRNGIEPVLISETIAPISVPVDLQLLGNRINELKLNQDSDRQKILPLLVITTKVCPPCVNNVADYAELLNDHPLFFEPTLLFIDVEESSAERFIAITDLDIAFEVFRTEDAISLFREAEQNLMFVDPQEQIIFQNIVIPNGVTPLDYKEAELEEALTFWKNNFATHSVSDLP